MSLGRYPGVSASAARKDAEKKLAAVKIGHDPAGDLAARRAEMTVADLIQTYERDGLRVLRGGRIDQPMKPLTAQYTKARLAHHVVPLLGKRRVSDVTGSDVKKLARDVAAGRTAKDEKVGPRKRIIVRGGEGAARKSVRDLSALFAFAIREGIVSANPVTGAGVGKTDNKRIGVELAPEAVFALGQALNELEADGMNPKAANITRLWALTGARRNEIAGLKWSEVDLARGLLTLEDTKTGKSVRPLAAAAWALLKGLRADAADDAVYVFPAERGDGFFQGTKGAWPRIVKKAGLPGLIPHALRHTLGSLAASSGEGLLMVGAILGHANARSTQLYARVDHDPARLAADRATAGIAAAFGRATPAPLDPKPEPTAECAEPALVVVEGSWRRARKGVEAHPGQTAMFAGSEAGEQASRCALWHRPASRAYRRGDAFEKRRALMADWSAYCEAAGDGQRRAAARRGGLIRHKVGWPLKPRLRPEASVAPVRW